MNAPPVVTAPAAHWSSFKDLASSKANHVWQPMGVGVVPEIGKASVRLTAARRSHQCPKVGQQKVKQDRSGKTFADGV